MLGNAGDGDGRGRSLIRHRFDKKSSFHFKVVTAVAVPDIHSHGFLSPFSPLSQRSRSRLPISVPRMSQL